MKLLFEELLLLDGVNLVVRVFDGDVDFDVAGGGGFVVAGGFLIAGVYVDVGGVAHA